MAKFYGSIGYVETVETSPGVFKEVSTERNYSCDILRKSKRFDSNEQLNDNLNISNQFSILADEYAYQHFYALRYIKILGACWKITDVEVQYPRMTLTVGGIYNGKEPDGATSEARDDSWE